MNMRSGSKRYRLSMLAVIASLLIGMIGLPPASAVATPTIGAIVVDDFDCETGALEARVPVSNLERVSDAADESAFPFRWSWEAHFEGGSSFSPQPFFAFNPPASHSPYNNDVFLTDFVPTNGMDGGVGPDPLVSIFIEASVGHVDGEPTFSTSITYTVICGDDLVAQLIAVLKAILQDILGGS